MPNRSLSHLALPLLIALAALLGLAAVPAGTEKIDLDKIAGKKGAVAFSHAKHAAEYKLADGKAISCKACHHTLEADTPKDAKAVKPCTECHVAEGQAQKEHGGKKAPFVATSKNGKVDNKSIVFHANCMEACHKTKEMKAKKLHACKTCHPKE